MNNLLGCLILVILTIAAFLAYAKGSYIFYRFSPHQEYRYLILTGLSLDLVMGVTASTGMLPIMDSDLDAPWHSWLFVTHVITASIGMFGFLYVFVYTMIRGKYRPYGLLKPVTYRILLPAWCLGSGIGIVNFITRMLLNVNLYRL